jgi:hypothetical protein
LTAKRSSARGARLVDQAARCLHGGVCALDLDLAQLALNLDARA